MVQLWWHNTNERWKSSVWGRRKLNVKIERIINAHWTIKVLLARYKLNWFATVAPFMSSRQFASHLFSLKIVYGLELNTWSRLLKFVSQQPKMMQQFGLDVSASTHTTARVLPKTGHFDFSLEIPARPRSSRTRIGLRCVSMNLGLCKWKISNQWWSYVCFDVISSERAQPLIFSLLVLCVLCKMLHWTSRLPPRL